MTTQPLRVVSVGGGPAGMFSAILMKQSDPRREIVVYERNAADDTFGFGVVFSQETLTNIEEADPETFARIAGEFRTWSAIDVHLPGFSERSDGHAFSALGRKRLLQIIGERAIGLGVTVRYQSVAPPLDELQREYDLVLAADGVNSAIRSAVTPDVVPSIDQRSSKYVWYGTTRPFDCFNFLFVDTEWGRFWAHVYPYDDTHATFIVETDDATWRRAGLEAFASVPRQPGETDQASLEFCERLFAEHLQGHHLLGNNSGWLSFNVVRNTQWSSGNAVLLGDAAHTAHFSIGSGTKLALEDAIALAHAVDTEPDVAAALKAYEIERRPAVESVQRSAQTSLEWFEGVQRYTDLDPRQMVFQLLTRSQRITYDNLRVRDPKYMGRLDTWLAEQTRAAGLEVADGTPPMFHPYRLRGLTLPNRVVVSPMAQYSCKGDGVPTEWHLVHLGSRAVGGAGLVLTEMTCVSPEGRITPGCPGLWNDEQEAAWKRIVDFVHDETDAAIGIQIGHSGRKGSTKAMWEGIDDPLESGGWDVLGPSSIPYRPDSPAPREMTEDDIARVVSQHVEAAERAARAGFDLIELHFAHGYLVSSFLSPLSNRRTDEYGGSAENRARFALRIVDAVRAVWPQDKPMTVRISATDWVHGGFTGDDAVELAGMLADHGVDLVDVSTGQTSIDARPAYGRLYQTPYSDRIRHEVGIATMTVGAVSSVDDVNTIIMAGRADLCALARPHLVDPYWTMNAALDQKFDDGRMPVQYLSGRSARRREQQP